eukprot:GHVL01006536.1.p1 GENE.GHVL01006536.1~~GHVL01006536.1.p1  ORF type:complete len:840 (+),score=193.99 GHVL01006536.1:524-3043(+)
MNNLRTYARYTYLEKREDQQLDLLERQLDDKKWLYKTINVSEAENNELKKQEELVSLVKEHQILRKERGKMDEYIMPDEVLPSDRSKALDRRYVSEAAFENEQDTLEKGQIKNVTAVVGSKKGREGSKKYDLVLEEIDFVIDNDLPGTVLEEDNDEFDEFNMNISYVEREKISKNKRLYKANNLKDERKTLPIYKYRDELLTAIRDYDVLVIVGETGSGKTTQIPQYLYEVGYTKIGRIGCTQPRRVAAMSVAARVSNEMGTKLGHEVGYSIRFEDLTTDKTIIKYMTDGMLLREFLNEPDLKTYSVIIIDEAHERTLHTDVLFGLVKDLSRFRNNDDEYTELPFKLLISSATLDAEKFSEYFDDAPIFNIPGRRYPVRIMYTKAPEANFLEASVITILQIHTTQPPGDILVFFTGQQEIEDAMEMLAIRTRGLGTSIKELIVLPIYASLPTDLQSKIFEPTPPGARKVVLATNIAETSVTIDNIVYVVDPGFCKQNTHNPKTGMDSLIITPISKASANQRAGRSGRVRPGMCFRLYTRFSYEKELEDSNVPEIQRTNLGNVVLMLKSLGIDDLIHFDFMDPPAPESLIRSLEQLYALGALNDQGDLTKLGRRMAEFPVDPMESKSLIQSEKYKCVEEVLTIYSMLGCGNTIFYRPKTQEVHADNARKNFFRKGGDHLTLLTVYKQWEETNYSQQWCLENFIQHRSMKRARDIRDQLVDLLERVEIINSSNPNDSDSIRKAITAGFFYHGAKLNKSGSYTTIKHPHTVDIHPQSSLKEYHPKVLVYHQLSYTTKEYMREVIEIKPSWLIEVAPHYYAQKDIEFSHSMPKQPPRATPQPP